MRLRTGQKAPKNSTEGMKKVPLFGTFDQSGLKRRSCATPRERANPLQHRIVSRFPSVILSNLCVSEVVRSKATTMRMPAPRGCSSPTQNEVGQEKKWCYDLACGTRFDSNGSTPALTAEVGTTPCLLIAHAPRRIDVAHHRADDARQRLPCRSQQLSCKAFELILYEVCGIAFNCGPGLGLLTTRHWLGEHAETVSNYQASFTAVNRSL